jgi:hypothetical protein
VHAHKGQKTIELRVCGALVSVLPTS